MLQQTGQSQFDVRNNSQVFNANSLAIAYGHRQIFAVFYNEIQKTSSVPEREILKNLLRLYGANLLVTTYMGILYEGGFVVSGSNINEFLQTGILELLPIIKTDAVALVDAISPPDFIINSPLGMSDGKIYQHLESFLYQTPDTFTRPSWWKELVHRDFLAKL